MYVFQKEFLQKILKFENLCSCSLLVEILLSRQGPVENKTLALTIFFQGACTPHITNNVANVRPFCFSLYIYFSIFSKIIILSS